MAGGRRRRRSSASSSTSNAWTAGALAADGRRPPPLVSADAPTPGGDSPAANPPAANGDSSRLALDGADDPFAYDSELETLSSVSSHSSIGSTNSDDLDQALSNPDALSRVGGSDDDDDDGVGMLLDDRDPSASADPAIHSESASRDSPKGGSDSDRAAAAGDYGRFMAKPARGSGGTSARRRRLPSASSRQAKNRAPRQAAADNNSDSNSSSGADGAEPQEAELAPDNASEAPDATADASSQSPAGAAGAVDSKAEGDDGGASSSSSSDEDAAANEVRRSAALSELVQIEVEFAQLRERLYCERMQQVQIEEEQLLSGRHAEYTRCVEEVTKNYTQHLERLKYGHEAWAKQRQGLHETWTRTLSYTFLERRQELRRRLISAHQRRIWRVRDMRVKEEEQFEARAGLATSAVDEDVALIMHQSVESIEQLKQARRVAQTVQRCLVHSRKHQLAAPGLDPAEMDADYRAMSLAVYPRTPKAGPRRVFVPPLVPESGSAAAAAAVAGKKRKPRQPRQPKKRLAVDAADKPAAADGLARAPPVDGQAAWGAKPPQPQPPQRVDVVGARLPLAALPDSAPRPPPPQAQLAAGSSSGGAGDRSSHGSVDIHVPPGTSGPLGLKV